VNARLDCLRILFDFVTRGIVDARLILAFVDSRVQGVSEGRDKLLCKSPSVFEIFGLGVLGGILGSSRGSAFVICASFFRLDFGMLMMVVGVLDDEVPLLSFIGGVGLGKAAMRVAGL